MKTEIKYLLLFILISFSCIYTWAAEPAKPVILCSTTQIYDFAKNVAGEHCEIICVIAAGTNPHTYQPTPGDAKTAGGADLLLENGLHLEGKNWMATLAADAGKPVVTCTDGIKPLIIEASGKKIRDPHAWFDPENAAVYVRNIANGLAAIDPQKKDIYWRNAYHYLAKLKSLDSWIRLELHTLSIAKRVLVTSHDAFNYFARSYGFRAEAPVGWSTGSEVGAGMTPGRRKAVIDSIKSFNVRAIFVETSVNPKVTRELAKNAGVAIGGELYSDSMGEEGSEGESYIGMMKYNVKVIKKALIGG